MIRLLVVDDHQAVRAGLVGLLRQEPGFVPAATAASAREALERAAQREFDVALVDYHLPDATGVELCRQLRGTPVLIYTALASDRLAIAARVAGAAGLVSKAAPIEDLFDALRAAARGGTAFAPLRRDVVTAAARPLSADQLPIFGMALERTSHSEMASALRLDPDELERRIAQVVTLLSPSPPRTA